MNMAVVEDWNELTHHLLEVTLQHLQSTKGPIPGTVFGSAASKMGTPSFGQQAIPGGQGQFYQTGGIRQPNFGGNSVKGEPGSLSNTVKHIC